MRDKRNLTRLYFKVIKEMFSYVKKQCLLIIIFSTAIAFESYVFLSFIKYITNTVINLAQNSASIRILEELKTTALYILVIIGLKVLTGVYSIVKIDYTNSVKGYLNKNIKTKLSSVWYEDFESEEIYGKINRVTEKVFNGYNAIIESITRIVEIVFYLAFYIVLLSKINAVFAVLVCLSLLISGLIATKMSKLQYKTFVDITPFNQKRDYLCNVSKDKSIHHEYQSCRLFGYIFDKYEQNYWKAAKMYLKIHGYTILAQAKALLMFTFVSLSAYLYVIYGIMQGTQDISVLTMMVFLFDNMFSKSASLSYYISNRTNDMLGVNEYYELLNRDEEINVDKKLQIEKAPVIEFKNIRYKYPQSDKYALDGLSLKIRSGEKIAIVGDNGSGKTTFTNILMGFIPGFEGQVIVDGKPMHENYSKLRKSLACMAQDFCTFQFDIKENIAIGDTSADFTDSEIENIVERIGLKDFTMKLPDNIKTKLGQLDDGGIDLSRGQWQKLSAGRLLAGKDAKIWVLDEPTAYLDPLAEIEMYDFLFDLAEDRTTIFISHRLGFAKKADRIIVFGDGKIVEEGTHNELMNSDGRYKKMYETQEAWYA